MKHASTSTTKERLLRTAEGLFAPRGIDAVSMGSICAEAGQRNNTVLQYHFGDRQNPVEAMLADPMGSINERRQRMADQIRSEFCEGDLHRLVAVVEQVRSVLDELAASLEQTESP